MNQTEIKYEFDGDAQMQCRTCLSVGRKLYPVGKYFNIFWLITGIDLQKQEYGKTLFCWECIALLRRVAQFKYLVQRANMLLESGQSYTYGSLSNLTVVTFTDAHPHTIYLNSNTTHKSSVKIESSTNRKESNKFICHDDNNFYDACLNESPSLEHTFQKGSDKDIKVDETVKSVNSKLLIKKNQWVKKQAIRNKKPKFKILSCNENDIGVVFNVIRVTLEEIMKNAKNKRKSRNYKCKLYKCDKCELGFKNKNSWHIHCKACHNEYLQFTCDLCGQTLSEKHKLVKHISKHQIKYQCRLCQFTCYTKSERRKHLTKQHNQIYECVKCKLIFERRRDFFKHYQEWHEKYICDYCGISFKMKYCIKNHIRKQHSPIECKICNKKFARYNGLWLHNKVTHSPSQPSAYCVECDKRYPDIYRYRWHLANSMRHKPRKKVKIPCSGCDKVFSKKIYMTDHYNLVHLKNYKYRCEQCNKNFIRNADLVKHNRRVHEGILPPKNKICYVCGRGFSTNKILTNHLRTHSGERPFPCSHCSARFAQSAALAGHVKALHSNTT